MKGMQLLLPNKLVQNKMVRMEHKILLLKYFYSIYLFLWVVDAGRNCIVLPGDPFVRSKGFRRNVFYYYKF